MTDSQQELGGNSDQLRLLLEELCSELCWFEHAANDGSNATTVRIDREYPLDAPGAFADIRVVPADSAPYLVEIKFGRPEGVVLQRLKRKYAEPGPALAGVSRIVVVVDSKRDSDGARFEAELAQCLAPGLKLEIWDEQRLIQLLRDHFQVEVPAITPANLLEVRNAIDRTHGFYAFGGESLDAYVHEPLKAELIWHFGFRKLQQLRETKHLSSREILPPGLYRGVAVLIADLSSFSSYVRDTPDSSIIRECLTSFYSKARYQIINHGGMFYQFVGDEVIGFFGIPDWSPGFSEATFEAARGLIAIGNSVSQHWQRQIDRVQASGGVHIGLSIGDLQIVSLRPFSRTHIGAVGDSINVAARLMSAASSNEITATNSFLQSLSDASRARFREVEPVEAKNVGRIKAWKFTGRDLD